MVGATFILLQSIWHQYRLIVIYLPFILMFSFAGIYYLTRSKTMKKFQFFLILLLVCLYLTTISRTIRLANLNLPALKAYIAGDLLYGYTQDWINYIKISQWAAKNIPQDKIIGCRKASVSFIQTNGRYFYSIDKVPGTNLDSYLAKLDAVNGKYLIINEVDLNRIPYTDMIWYTLMRHTDALLQSLSYDQSGIGYNKYNFKVYIFPHDSIDMIKSDLIGYGAPFETDINVLFNKLKNEVKNYMVFEPDQLLENLKEKKIEYLILASLRREPGKKTNLTINTVERYVSLIQAKYPDLFRTIHQIGSNNDEPAAVVQIQYDIINGK
jgi:hypothetical protein